MIRCKWCGQFVKADTPQTVRAVQVARHGTLAWRTYSQILCPADAASWSSDTPWNRAPTEQETREAEIL